MSQFVSNNSGQGQGEGWGGVRDEGKGKMQKLYVDGEAWRMMVTKEKSGDQMTLMVFQAHFEVRQTEDISEYFMYQEHVRVGVEKEYRGMMGCSQCLPRTDLFTVLILGCRVRQLLVLLKL